MVLCAFYNDFLESQPQKYGLTVGNPHEKGFENSTYFVPHENGAVIIPNHSIVYGDRTNSHDGVDLIVDISNDMFFLHFVFVYWHHQEVSLHLSQKDVLKEKEIVCIDTRVFFGFLLVD